MFLLYNSKNLKAVIRKVGVRLPFWNHSKGRTGASLTYKIVAKDQRIIPAQVLLQEDTQR